MFTYVAEYHQHDRVCCCCIDYLAKCADKGGVAATLVPAVKAMQQNCLGDGSGKTVSAECGAARANTGNLDPNQPCSAASVALYDGIVFCVQHSTCVLCFVYRTYLLGSTPYFPFRTPCQCSHTIFASSGLRYLHTHHGISPVRPCLCCCCCSIDFLAKCAGQGGSGSDLQKYYDGVKAYKQECSKMKTKPGTAVSAECGAAGDKVGKIDPNQPCSAASLALYDGIVFCVQHSACVLCFVYVSTWAHSLRPIPDAMPMFTHNLCVL